MNEITLRSHICLQIFARTKSHNTDNENAMVELMRRCWCRHIKSKQPTVQASHTISNVISLLLTSSALFFISTFDFILFVSFVQLFFFPFLLGALQKLLCAWARTLYSLPLYATHSFHSIFFPISFVWILVLYVQRSLKCIFCFQLLVLMSLRVYFLYATSLYTSSSASFFYCTFSIFQLVKCVSLPSIWILVFFFSASADILRQSNCRCSWWATIPYVYFSQSLFFCFFVSFFCFSANDVIDMETVDSPIYI